MCSGISSVIPFTFISDIEANVNMFTNILMHLQREGHIYIHNPRVSFSNLAKTHMIVILSEFMLLNTLPIYHREMDVRPKC